MRKTKSYYSLPYNPALKQRAKELRKAGNLAEVLLWNQIKNKQFLNLDFDRQKIIGNYIVDFFCGEKMLVIEIDGYSHNDKHDYDYKRDKYLKSLNLKIIHLLDNDVKNDINTVLTFLRNPPDLKVTPPAEGNYSPDVIEQDGGGI